MRRFRRPRLAGGGIGVVPGSSKIGSFALWVWPLFRARPTACAAGCILAPLRSLVRFRRPYGTRIPCLPLVPPPEGGGHFSGAPHGGKNYGAPEFCAPPKPPPQ